MTPEHCLYSFVLLPHAVARDVECPSRTNHVKLLSECRQRVLLECDETASLDSLPALGVDARSLPVGTAIRRVLPKRRRREDARKSTTSTKQAQIIQSTKKMHPDDTKQTGNPPGRLVCHKAIAKKICTTVTIPSSVRSRKRFTDRKTLRIVFGPRRSRKKSPVM